MKPLFHYATISQLSEQIRQKIVSPVALVTECLDCIERVNPTLNAFITIMAADALDQAKIHEREINNNQWRGPLHGIPVAVKDFFDTKGTRTTAAFKDFKNRMPSKDAVAVAKLKEAGAIIVGKTNMHELGMGTTSVVSYFGSVHNPWNTEYVAGGSSGGSAAAVAAGLCFATVDTDAVGSCRLPASCCGVTGFKGRYGLISAAGILDGEKTDETILKLSHVAITTRSSHDTAILLEALIDDDGLRREFKKEYETNFTTRTIGLVSNFQASQEVKDVFNNAVRNIEKLGFKIKEIKIPFESATFNTATIDRDRKEISEKLFSNVDLLLLPTMVEPTLKIDSAKKLGPQAISPNNTFFANYYSLPAISIPCGADKNGLPLGLQLVGPTTGESIVLRTSDIIQQATTWHLHRPNLQ